MKHCICKTYPLDYDPRKTLEIRITERECDVPNCPNNYKHQQQFDDPDWSLYATPHTNRSTPRSKHFDQSVFSYIVKALSDSSISGVNKVFASKTSVQRILWFIVLTGCLSGFAYQTYKFSVLYRKKPSVVQIEVENDGLAEFPAITLCNTNRFRKSEYCKYKAEECAANPYNLTISEFYIGEVIFQLLSEKNLAMKEQLGHSADMIQSCIFNGIPQMGAEECSQILQYSYDPDYGNCWTIPPRNSKGHVLEAREADFWQEANDLSLLIDLESDEFMEKRRRPGIIVTVHDDSTAPDIHTDGHLIGSGYIYTFTIQKLCTVGCSQYYQNLKCKFVTQNLSLFYKELPYDPEKITEEERVCAEAEEKRTQDYCRSICGLPCRDTIFVVTSSLTELTEKEIYEHHIHSRINRSWEDKRRNLAMLKIYFSTLEHTIYRHIPKYDTMELFSYLGGYSGVWLGFSLLTVYELMEILFYTAKFAFQKHQRVVQHRKVFRGITNTKKASRHFTKKRRMYR
ncbi:acid-sensing ion channel 4-A-like [Argiope bruennichi]|uniref:acid-sensing ion channel 4-A-like n=1 Tax=Argiope bruennichi TaxID=94029 RepID=UPI0024949D75|nr:acid-sensing ion channel 4-A-like [Argiope bruennichi]